MKISKEQQSIIAISAGLLIIAWIKHSYIFLIAGGIFAVTFPFPSLNIPVHKSWMFLSEILGWVSSHIILSVLFYFFLTPISFLRKLTGKQDMRMFSKNETTAFHPRNHFYNSKDFLNPW